MSKDWGEQGWDWLQAKLRDPESSPDGRRLLPRLWNDRASASPAAARRWWDHLVRGQRLLPLAAAPLGRTGRGARQPGRRPDEIRCRPRRNGRWQPGERTERPLPVGLARMGHPGVGRNPAPRQRPRNSWAHHAGRHVPAGTESALQVVDMAGNVWEWQADYADKAHGVLGLRGGSWGNNERNARLLVRYAAPRSSVTTTSVSGGGCPPSGIFCPLRFCLLCSVRPRAAGGLVSAGPPPPKEAKFREIWIAKVAKRAKIAKGNPAVTCGRC